MKIGATIVAGLVLAAPQAAAKTGVPTQVLGFVGSGRSVSVVRLDALTLEPISKAARVGTPNPSFVARVAGGGRVAIATGVASLRFLDFQRMRWEFTVPYPGRPAAAVWNYADKLVTLTSTDVIVVDPTKGRLGAVHALGGIVVASTVLADRIVALISPGGAIGPAKLAVIDDSGRVRTVPLPRIRAGGYMGEGDTFHFEYPALAVNTRTAVVIAADGAVVDVRLDRLSATSRALSRSLAGALKRVNGSTRVAQWVDANMIALSGLDTSFDGTTQHPTDAGLTLIDTRDWSARTIDTDTFGLVPSGFGPRCIGCSGVLVTYGRNGIAGYGSDGTLRFRLFPGTTTRPSIVSGSYAYIASSLTRYTIVDTFAGRVVGTVDTRAPTILVPLPPQ